MKFIIVIIILFNLFSFIYFGVDKRKAAKKKRRIPEAHLIMSAFVFGGFGAYIAMFAFHHKTRKFKFRMLVPTAIICNIIIYYFLFHKLYHFF